MIPKRTVPAIFINGLSVPSQVRPPIRPVTLIVSPFSCPFSSAVMAAQKGRHARSSGNVVF